MTVMRWADARGLIGNTETWGWNRHDCRRVWLVARVDRESTDPMWGNLIYLSPPGEPDWYELEDPILAFDNLREAVIVAADAKHGPWSPLNLYDLLRFEDGQGVRFAASRPLLLDLAAAWREKQARIDRSL